MNILRYGTHIIEQTTPAGIIITGAAVALAVPRVRHSFRSAAVLVAGGILQATDRIKSTLAHTKEEMNDFVAEAQDKQGHHDDSWQSLKDKARKHRHRLAVATAAGVLTVSDKASAMCDEFDSIMKEARNARDPIRAMEKAPQETTEPGVARYSNHSDIKE
jgi:hypothetical protein